MRSILFMGIIISGQPWYLIINPSVEAISFLGDQESFSQSKSEQQLTLSSNVFKT